MKATINGIPVHGSLTCVELADGLHRYSSVVGVGDADEMIAIQERGEPAVYRGPIELLDGRTVAGEVLVVVSNVSSGGISTATITGSGPAAEPIRLPRHSPRRSHQL